MRLRKGTKIRVFYVKGNYSNRLYHVRGDVDGLPVVKYWNRYCKRWVYKVLTPEYLEAYSSVITYE